jgi:metal-responsive CopG/Arc/MetJ family transcriptional regulator
MKTAVSIPDPLFAEAEKAARELNISRSKLVQTALEQFLERRRDAAITEAIRRSLAENSPTAEEQAEEDAWIEHGEAMLVESEPRE